MKTLTITLIGFGVILTVFGIFLIQPNYVGHAVIQKNPHMGTALAGSGVSIMVIAALSENWKKRYEKEIKSVTELLTELYGEFGNFEVDYSDKIMAKRIASREDIRKMFEKRFGKYEGVRYCVEHEIDRIREECGIEPHPYKTTILLPTKEVVRRYLNEGYAALNKIVEEGASTSEVKTLYRRIQATTEQLKNLRLTNALAVAHELGHEVSIKRQPELIMDYFQLKPVAEGVATGIGFIYLLNKAKKGDSKKKGVLNFIENVMEEYRFGPPDDEHRQGLCVLGDFDPRAKKSMDEMMDYLLERVNSAMENPRESLARIKPPERIFSGRIRRGGRRIRK